ncbi:MAG: hypothetical protein DCF17_04945 [Shackletoniella antarctica]|uniref:Uncharacterized protein n=1 Tax=Shackletoniella antarctica TaxID=268115 RepID=A0A2W4WQ13_9CYAN|nr:MAG: hypothetical protein DCF17_04945 [Shackletoniella antarctica]
MSQLIATALLISFGAGSVGLVTALNQPAQSFTPSPIHGTLVSADAAGSALGQLMAQGHAEMWSAPGGSVSADICLSLPDWQRPPELAQIKQLEAMPSYGVALQADPLADMAKTWWSHEIFSFTTYGLSARTDPLYLSGIWTAIDDTWSCYSGDQPEQINRGDLAELWLLHHRLVGLEWQDNQYVATVEPASTGLQLVQFLRQESALELPLSIVTTTGQALAVMSGDWQE